MPIWTIDAEGRFVSEHTTGYPAPDAMLETLRAQAPEGFRVVDIPPLHFEHWYLPADSDEPRIRPPFDFKLDKTEVVADGRDRIFIAGIPVGTEVSLTGPLPANLVVGDDSFTVGFVVPGRYEVRFVAAPHRAVVLPFTVFVEPRDPPLMWDDRPDFVVQPDPANYARRVEERLTEALTPAPTGFASSVDEARATVAWIEHIGPLSEAQAGERPPYITRIEAEAAAHGVEPAELAQAIIDADDAAHAMTLKRIAVIRAFRELVAGGADVLEMDAYLVANGLQPLDKVA